MSGCLPAPMRQKKVRGITIDGEIALIPLTQGFIAIIDAAAIEAFGEFARTNANLGRYGL